MGNEGAVSLFATFVAIGVVSISLYFLVLRPTSDDSNPIRGASGVPVNNNTNPTNNAVGSNRRRAAPDSRRAATNNANAAVGGNGTNNSSSSIDNILLECGTFPIHLAPASQSICRSGGSNLLVEGLLAFRHTRAAGYEQANAASPSTDFAGGDVAAQNRKERARILSRMLTLEDKASATANNSSINNNGNPPIRGSTFVASIPLKEVNCPKLRRALYLLATYYNLLVILVVPVGTTVSDLDKAKAQLRGGKADDKQQEEKLDSDCLPDHRIIAASTTAGRIAFVRQLGRVEVMLDFNQDVATELTRFGYRVINYNQTQLPDKTVSQLGSQLLS